MTTELLNVLLDDVMPDVPGIGLTLAERAILFAAIEFCDRSGAWQYNQALMSSIAQQPSYNFTPPADTEVVGVTQAWYNGKLIKFKSADQLEKEAINGDYWNLSFLPATLTAGPLVVGTQYQITGYVAGDDFTNVGAVSNANGSIFTATGTTPANWAGASVLSVTQNTNSTSTPWSAMVGTPQGFTIQVPSQFILVPMPDTSYPNSIQMTLSLKPTRAATGMEQWVMDKYRDELASGALSRLLIMLQKPWSNPQLGEFYKQRFETGINNAAAMNTMVQTLPSINIEPSPV